MADCLPAPNLYAFDSMTRCVIALALAALAAAPAAGPTYYAIVADGDTIIGYATYEARQGSERPETVDRSEIRLREQDQPELRVSAETVLRRDAAGRTVWMSEYSQTGSGWSRSEGRSAGGGAGGNQRSRGA